MLEAAGLPSSELRLEGDSALVEGDMAFSIAELEAATALPPAGPDEFVDKAWRSVPFETVGGLADDIVLRFGPGVPGFVADAFIRAGATWSSGSIGGCISIGVHPRTNRPWFLDITMRQLQLREFAVTHVPLDGTIAWSIELNSDEQCFTTCGDPERAFNLDECFLECFPTAWSMVGQTAAVAESVALHELGHALGFMHPNEGSLIPDTEPNDSDTVMRPGISSDTFSTLSRDDVKARDLVYGLDYWDATCRPAGPAPEGACIDVCDPAEGPSDRFRQCWVECYCGPSRDRC